MTGVPHGVSDSTHPNTVPVSRHGTARGQWLRWWRPVVGGALTVSGLLVALALGVLYRQTVETAERLMQTHSAVVVEEITRKLQTIDQRLELTALKLSRLDAVSAQQVPQVNAMLQAQIKGIPFVSAMWWVNAQGTVQYDSDPLHTLSGGGFVGAA